jgi:predicted CopG family antitoxin
MMKRKGKKSVNEIIEEILRIKEQTGIDVLLMPETEIEKWIVYLIRRQQLKSEAK